MYTGEPINIEDLASEKYDIDHIYPRHFVKDDSLENNLILVKKVENAHKSDNFPIESRIQARMQPMWKMLVDQELISREKYNRLTRTQDFTAEEQTGFIARQLVETRQGTKAVAGIFSSIFGNGRTVYVKAGNVSAFRQQFNLLKCREVNDLHHAQDAYLNIVVGNAYDVKFTRNPRRFIEEYRKNPKANEYHMYKLFENSVIRGDITAWDTRNDKSIRIVKSVMRKNTPLVTVRTEEVHGELFKQQIVSAETIEKVNGKNYFPVKTSESKLENTSRYGGFSKVTGTYFFLVEHTYKKRRVRTLEPVPLYLQINLKTKNKLEEYCANELHYEEPSVRLAKIKTNSLFKVDGYYLYVTGRSGNQLSVNDGVQLILSYEDLMYVRKMYGMLDENDYSKRDVESFKECNKILYHTLMKKFVNGIYRNRKPDKFGLQLKEGETKFNALSCLKQFYVLKQIILLVQMKSRGVDLSDIGEAKGCGESKLSRRLSDYTEAVLINQSVTGLFESRIDLLKV
jgi:CRISPR-associated endonuclease Csn1